MTVGSFGNVIFQVSANKIETIFNIKQSGSASYASHNRHTGNTLLEFVGRNADKFTFEMTLSAQLGVNVQAEINKLVAMEQSGSAQKLVIGKKVYGRYKWVIVKHSITYKYFDKANNPTHADVSLTLEEYLKWK